MSNEPSLPLVWDAFTGFQKTAALKTAIELDLFTQIGMGASEVDDLAKRCGAAPRGLRPLLNVLAVDGYLTRDGTRYGLTPTAAAFLDRNSPAFIGSGILFIASPLVVESFAKLTEAVRRGGTAIGESGTLAPEHPVWVDFARAMGPIAGFSAALLGGLLQIEKAPAWKILDIAAGHGMFGITLAKQNPRVDVTGLDWKNVLVVAEENARAAGVSERYHKIEGSAFDVPLGSGYDLILVPNFLHHFDPPTCEKFLAKAGAALAPKGCMAIVEFVQNDDRSGPADAVGFALVMLATTPSGDAYTFPEYQGMLKRAGFSQVALHELVPTPTRVIIAER